MYLYVYNLYNTQQDALYCLSWYIIKIKLIKHWAINTLGTDILSGLAKTTLYNAHNIRLADYN